MLYDQSLSSVRRCELPPSLPIPGQFSETLLGDPHARLLSRMRARQVCTPRNSDRYSAREPRTISALLSSNVHHLPVRVERRATSAPCPSLQAAMKTSIAGSESRSDATCSSARSPLRFVLS